VGLTLTINGADVLDYLEPGPGNPGLDKALQARTVFRFVLKDRTGTFRPVVRQDVIAELDGVRIFGGVITYLDEGDWGDFVGNWFTVECADWASVLETMEFNGVAVGTTLKDVVQHIVTARLAGRGFTVDSTMAAGPVIESQGYSFRYISDIFDELQKITAWPWTVDAFKRIKFAPADGRPAPFSLTATNDTINAIRVASSIDGYVNVVWLHYGAASIREVDETWYATAGQTTFDAVLFPNPEGIVSPPTVVVVDGVEELVGDASAPWSWSVAVPPAVPSYARLTRNAGGLTGGAFVEARYNAQFPAAIVEQDTTEVGLYGESSIVETAEDVYDLAQARQLAQGILRERGGLLRRIAVTTHTPGLEPGHVVPVDVAERAIDEDCLVLSSRMIYDGRIAETGEDYWRFDLDLVEGTQYSETWQKFFRDVSREGTGAAVSASGSVGPPSGGGDGSGGSATPLPSFALYRYLGGSRAVSGFVPTAASDPWQPIAGYVDAFLDRDVIGGRTAQVSVNVRGRSAGYSITPRVVTIDGSGVRDTVLVTGSPVSSAAWAYQSLVIPAGTGLTPIRVEFTTSLRDVDAFVANAMLDVF